jgi:hypothetical protein
MNWPSEPEAVAMPNAQLRFSGRTTRPSAAITILKEEKATPVPTSNPPPTLNISGVSVKAIISKPRK